MFRFVITILLINTCYRSLGYPIGTHTVYSLDNSLKALANRCENQFLVSQIKEKISECNVTVPPFKIKEMQCLIFYDINTQLCDAIGNSNLIQQNDLINNLQNVINLDPMCTNITKNWKFTNFPDIPLYKKIAEDVFSTKKRCDKVCEVADVTSDDSNSFCKYYKWGSEVLNIIQLRVHGSQIKSPTNAIVPAVPVVTSTDTKVVETVIANTTVISTTKNVIPSSNYEIKDANLAKPETTKINIVQPEIKEPKEPNPNFVDQKANELPAIKVNEGVKKTIEPSVPKTDKVVNNSEKSIVAQKAKVSVESDDDKTILEEEQPPKKVDIEKEDQLLNNQMKDKEFNEDIEDDMDSEEDEKPELQDNSEISIGQGDKQIVKEKPKDNLKSIAPIITSYADKSEEFISKMPQDEFAEDDDHFFPFFLTAVIIVVLLYVLYHNKSKFTKVVLGLIIEGRQSGRRRNSRGHAYRRLDTLEQAMSTNSPAPPSKIIY